jgi:5-methylcytosine-specific restriction endonuclease McrA
VSQARYEYTKRNDLLLDMGYTSYGEYLRSALWAKIRKRVFVRDGGQCVVCGSKADAVHHMRYTRAVFLGQADHHLLSICQTCHTRAEFKGSRKASPSDARKSILAVAAQPKRTKRRRNRNRRNRRNQKPST